MLTEENRFSNALKSIARNQEIKAYLQNSKELFPLLMKGANRFVSGTTRGEGMERVIELHNKGYQISLEFIGENTTSERECKSAKKEFEELIKELGAYHIKGTVSFDLSHIGMMISDSLAYSHLKELAKIAQENDIQLMISMEESQKTDKILSIYRDIAKFYANVGITLQVHLHRSLSDLKELLQMPGRIRLVKGAYQEPEGIFIPRSEELNKWYIEFVSMCVETNHPISIATHDENLLMELKEKGYLQSQNVEVEMLDGVRSDLLKILKEEDIQSKVYVTYGTEWYLYLVHRIAEYPPNIFTLISDIIEQHDVGIDKY
ncbi:proline dehydrogenase family protein [Heyndrickxia sporothermodurans]|uniref:proline dehydrogenase n=2 Tax=Heyndrickxia sporothermodurans TaxID=46224 RepID=A0AB37HFM0_9BACI|nr:proline dehydrogenase family protein [Heyndrickxia sporothermodurans]MBL5768759.1 proline dehydrogenase family protein [Heyndrickxia sporothermodurans]MBL5772485.1 proline dehydrogenase family protein [Heyndrickxia sporothermodurans]MBL5776002.1 proline dehydrogenase family protein [Heyndrickxia sporothermodurans]MBL5779522.1 proline dehydrogenase family protein [Heyndrickxia sporothermodurans]MBL5782676.1 proline dehydrogenase family protein [Heyndrickxia sporothermodurans]